MVDDLGSRGVRLVFDGAYEGLRRIGKELRVFPLDPGEPDYKTKFRNDLLRYKPDAVLLANFPATYYLRQFGIEEFPFVCMTWLMDDPGMMGDSRFADHEIVLVADPKFERGARERGARRVFFLPVAAPDEGSAEYRREWEAPLAYVGSIYIPQKLRSAIRPDQRQWVTALLHKKVQYPAKDFSELIHEEGSEEIELSDSMRFFLYCEANRIYRYRYLHALAPLGLRLYGNAIWKTETRGSNLEPCFQGSIESFTDYPNLIRSVKININLRSLQGFDAPTHRDFLVPRLGGFLLSSATRVKPVDWKVIDSENRFHLNRFPWSVEKHTPLHLSEAAHYYLEHESERRDWIQRTAEEIARHHTYSRRMEQLGEILDEESQKSRAESMEKKNE